MTAPATSHDLRCPALNGADPGVPCMCARGASVVRLPVGNVRACVMCGRSPVWEINRSSRSCSRCLADAVSEFYAHDYDGLIPCVVAPLPTGGPA